MREILFERFMDKILHYLKDPKLWEVRYIPYYYGSCRILSISRIILQEMELLGWPNSAFEHGGEDLERLNPNSKSKL